MSRPKLAVQITGKIRGQTVQLCGDQGAVTSIICYNLASSLGLTHRIQPLSQPCSILTGLGHTKQASGLIKLHFELDGHQFQHTVLVVPDFSNLFLLGIDFFESHAWTKPEGHATYYIFDHHKRVSYSPHPLRFETDPSHVVTNRKYKIPVGATINILGHVQSHDNQPISVGTEGLMRPDHHGISNIKGLEVPNTVAEVYEGGRVRVIMTNISKQPISIPAGTKVAIFATSTFLGIVNRDGDDPTTVPDTSSTDHAPSTSSAMQKPMDVETTNTPVFSTFSAPEPMDVEGLDEDPEYIPSIPSALPSEPLPDQAFIEHLQSMTLTPQQTRDILDVLLPYRDVFATNPRKPNLNRILVHSIDTGDAPPVKRRPYNTSPAEDAKMRQEVLSMLELGIVRPSSSPWSSPVVMVKKPQGVRFCFDARALNAVTKKDRYTLPRVKDLLRRFKGARYFSVCDAAAGFWGVPLAEDSIEKTAFITHFGLYEFLVMPFGLCNAPATFQRLMDLVLGNLAWECVCVFVDDCCIYSPTWEAHLKDLTAVLQRFREANLSLKLSKCSFGQEDVRYLGLRISAQGHGTDPEKIQAVRDMPPPRNASELQSVLGLFGYYRSYVKGYATIAEPLNDLLRRVPSASGSGNPPKSSSISSSAPAKKPSSKTSYQSKPWTWSDPEQQAFDQLKVMLTTAPVMGHPDFSGQHAFILDTDASLVGTGAVISQRYPDRDHVLGYYSYTLKPRERRWSTTEREAFAILKAIRNFRHILAGTPFIVVTDHASLRYLMQMKDPFGRISRWIMELQQYNFSVEHRSGVSHGNADSMSRPPVVQPDLHQLVPIFTTTAEPATTSTSTLPELQSSLPSMSSIQRLQQKDPVLSGYVSFLQNGSLVHVPDDVRPLLVDLGSYSLIDGTLYHSRKEQPGRDGKPVSRLQLIVPKELRQVLLVACHDNILAGHPGVQKTYERLSENYYWANMRADVYSWVKSCLTCASRKRHRTGATIGLRGITPGDRPFDVISMDFLGPLPETEAGNKYLLVINDYATRYPLAFPLPTNDAASVAKVMIERVFLEFGPPRVILSDRGTHFLNDLVHSITQLFMTRQVFSSGYRPQTAGITERMNQTLLDLLAMYGNRKQNDWDQLVPYVLFAYRTTYSEVIKNTPFYLVYGYEPVLPHEMNLLPPHLNQSSADQARNAIAANLNQARRLARDAVHKVQLATKTREDAHRRKPPSYKPGDLVMVHKPVIATGTIFKLASHIYQGPYKVERYIPGFRTIQVTHIATGESRICHVDNTKPFLASELREPLPEAPTPVHSEEAQRRALDQLDRACAVAKHVVGEGRARATIAHVLGHLSLPPLPPQLLALLPASVPSQAPTTPPPATLPIARVPSLLTAAPPAIVPAPPRPVAVENPSAPWRPSTKDLTPWFTPTSGSSPTGRSRSGRVFRPTS